jgi:hypothetical protein
MYTENWCTSESAQTKPSRPAKRAFAIHCFRQNGRKLVGGICGRRLPGSRASMRSRWEWEETPPSGSDPV